MGKSGQAIGMVLCLCFAFLSHLYSDQINELFKLEIDSQQDNSAPLLGLQQNESWLVVLVDFESDPLSSDSVLSIQDELEEFSEDYFSQALGKEVVVNVSVHETILRSPERLSAYGADGTYGRDYGDGSEFLPSKLAEFVATSLDENSLDSYDINNDGVVDRFLILHSTLAQEQGGGSSNRIWSHFTSFSDPVEKGEFSFEHYTMSSMRHGTNGLGTILHEMMHQFGAFDLYPIHDSGYSGSWKGIGVWDIMASGNWNGGGDSPALPTGPTMNAIGHGPTRELVLDWPVGSQGPCIGPSIAIDSRNVGGERLRIQIDEYEYLWIEKRTQQGFDASLPGEGILVLYEDLVAGDTAHNAMNIDQRRPYLKTIEADGNQEQLKGINDGVASDLFQPGDEFGEQGILVRDHDGVLVSWHAKVIENQGEWFLEFHSLNCSPQLNIDMDDFGSTVLQGDLLYLAIQGENSKAQCWGELTGTDGRNIVFTNSSMSNSVHYGTFSSMGTLDSTATFSGLIYCNEDVYDIKTTVTTLGTIPSPKSMKVIEQINVVDSTTIILPYSGSGNGDGEFTIEIEGPLSRVASSSDSLKIVDGNGTITIQIEPQGLLQDNMYVLGTIHLQSFNGQEWDVDVELKAKNDNGNPLVGNQSSVLSTFFLLFSLWFAFSLFGNKSNTGKHVEQTDQSDDEFFPGNHL